MRGDAVTFHERRWSEAQAKAANPKRQGSTPVGASLTEKLVSASTEKRDVANFDRVCSMRPLKPPTRRK